MPPARLPGRHDLGPFASPIETDLHVGPGDRTGPIPCTPTLVNPVRLGAALLESIWVAITAELRRSVPTATWCAEKIAGLLRPGSTPWPPPAHVRRAHIRYEDLVGDLPAHSHQLGILLEVQLDPAAVLNLVDRYHHQTACSPEASIGRWRRERTGAQASRIWDLLGDRLPPLGYPSE